MISQENLDLLACPEAKQPLKWGEPTLIELLNRRIREGAVSNRGGGRVTDPVEHVLVREDRHYLYPVRNGIPVLLIDEAIPVPA